MRKITKAICVALSLMLLVNLAGIEAAASDPATANQAEGSGEVNDVAPDKPDSADESDKPDDSTPEDEKQDDGQPEDGNDAVQDDGSVSTDVPAGNGETSSGDVDLDAQLPEQGDAVDDEKSLDTQTIDKINAEPVAGKNELKISWTGDKSKVYTVKASKSSNTTGNPDKTVEVTGLTTKIQVEQGIQYEITVTGKDDVSETGTIPAILLATPANLKAAASSGAVALSWSAVAGAESYKVAYNGKEEVVTTPSFTATGLANGTKYNFSVTAQKNLTDSLSNPHPYSSIAAAVSATPIGNKPSQVTGLTGIDGEKSAILTWSKAAYADSYAVYRYNSSKKTWDVVKSGLTQLTYTDKGLKAGQKYQYRIAGVNSNGTGALSSSIKISVKKTPGTKIRSIGYKAVLKSRAPLFGTSKSSKRLKYLSKGKKVTTTDYSRGRYEIKIGKKYYWISKDRLKFKASIWTTKDYSTKVKEDFVNKKKYSSPSKYLIWISHYTQRVVIYQGSKGKWKMIRSAKCATGTHLHMTPKGKFKVGKKEKGWFYKKTYEKPIVHFKGQNSFHSRIKNYKGGYADATIGRPRSKGCVRLYDEDINFIYKKCPKGTTVISL
ncbi:MAG: L,D-transpeptidase family protein [Dorea sp.]|jgi:hypothetical protein|nr:L,D-transpeptidase family protein [Dorea sp.]